ncbi:MAG: helix-turn-helix domain-containing protein [Bacteroidales bacterium]
MPTPIPTHKISEFFPEGIFIRRIEETDQPLSNDYAHRDDYFIFVLMEKGNTSVMIDFEERLASGRCARFILPGQVHTFNQNSGVSGWFLAIDPLFVKEEYKSIFEKASFLNYESTQSDESAEELKFCISTIYKRYCSEKNALSKSLLNDMLHVYIGMIADLYSEGLPTVSTNRFAAITFRFKSLLSAHYATVKRPSQYASMMSISSVYLNEAVKKTVGLTVGECIANEVMIHAKRMLYYTNLSVKEISYVLGYPDSAYFTRFFTKSAKISPVQFRAQFLE